MKSHPIESRALSRNATAPLCRPSARTLQTEAILGVGRKNETEEVI